MSSNTEKAFRWLNVRNGSPLIVMPYSRCAISRAEPPYEDFSDDDGRIGVGVTLDTETTGRDKTKDSIIEIGLRIFYYNDLGEVLSLGRSYDAFNDPGRPLPEEIVALTGIRDEDVSGQRIDLDAVHVLLSHADFIIAHNAGFDRPFTDRMMVENPVKNRWACSIEEIDWKGFGLPSQSLVALCMAHGFYTDAHRAGNDAEALVKLLSLRNAESDRTYLWHLLQSMRQDWVKISATGAPFEKKDVLKERGYRWDGDIKVWHRTMPISKQDEELGWLVENATRRPTVKVLNPMERYR